MADEIRELSYEEAIVRLEKIVGILESGSTGLEESLELFEEGTALAKFCNKSLTSAEQKILKLNGDNENEE
ncbi:MAG: exodeoxyribonuclease VII small subunit [Oscillospiraceae bacterium]|nr:exodeoxyribonuclease VII small subunit [Oscillospiraceae bacterium]